MLGQWRYHRTDKAILKSYPIPARFIGVSEGLDDLRPFVIMDFVAALLWPEE